MKIRSKLQIIAIVPLLVFLAAMGIAYWIHTAEEGYYVRGQQITRVSRLTQNLINLTYEYGITRGESASGQWQNQISAADRAVSDVAALLRSGDDSRIRALTRCFANARGLFAELMEYDRGYESKGNNQLLEQVRHNLVNRIILELQTALPPADDIHAELVVSIKRFGRLGTYLNVGIFLLLSLSLLALSLRITNSIHRSLISVQDGIRMVAGGNLEYRVNSETADELGNLARGFDGMTERLKTIIVSRDELQNEIADRNKTEVALRESEQRLAKAQRIAHIGHWELDIIHNVLIWSDEIYRIFEIDPERFGASYEAFLSAIHPDDRLRVDAAYKNSLRNRQPYEIDHRLLFPDGRIKFVREQCETSYDQEGVALRSLGTIQDITDLKRVEEEFRLLNQRNEMILNSAGEGIYGTDLNGNIMFINTAAKEMLGFRGEEVIGKNSHRTFHHTRVDGKPYPVEECPLYKSLNEGETYRGQDEVFFSRDGRMFFVEHVNTPLIENGEVVGAVVVFSDISERKLAEGEIRKLNEILENRVRERTADLEKKSDEIQNNQMALMNIVEDLNDKTVELEQANAKLQELDRLKSMFIASMSHELRTPLNSIIGFASIMINEWAGPLTAEQKENLSAVLRAGKHLLSLINDVIDVSKIEAGKIESIAEEFDISGVLQEAVDTLRKDIEKKGLAIEVETIRRSIRADRRRLLQCLLNLLSNAVKFTDRGSIHVSAAISHDSRFLELNVTDTGIGIQQNDLEKLFLPFERIVSPMRPVVPGTGLGLYLTRKITREVLKGDILVQSVYGQGSRFTMIMPMVG